MRYRVVFSDGYRTDSLDWQHTLDLVRWALRRAPRYGIRPVRVEAA